MRYHLEHPYNRASLASCLGWPLVENEQGCWIWEGPKTQPGYARCGDNRLHPIVWSLVNGKIPKGLIICHSCFFKSCLNPSHLYAGTYKQNNSDQDRRYGGRGRLDQQDYETIDKLSTIGWPKTEIAKLLKCSRENIWRYLREGVKYAKPSKPSK